MANETARGPIYENWQTREIVDAMMSLGYDIYHDDDMDLFRRADAHRSIHSMARELERRGYRQQRVDRLEHPWDWWG